MLATPQEEADDARKLLESAQRGQLSAGLLECPACGSADVVSDRVVSRAGTFLNTLLVGPVVQDATVSFKCRRCGATWQ